MARSLVSWPVIALAVGALGCGDDDSGQQQQPVAPKPTAAATPGAAGATAGNKLPEKLHIEDRVACPVPAKPTDPKGGKCDLKAPACPDHTYCLQLAQGSFCEPCPERDGIRHVFKDRDFAVEQNRDPFQSFLLQPFIKSPDSVPIDVTRKCVREDQMVATGNSYSDLKLVGIVAQGTQRKVLMVSGREGWIIKRGDCVGKEKAVVKDIGTGYITFLVDADTAAANQRPPEEYSVQLNPKQLTLNEPGDLPAPTPRTVIAPVAPPPAVVPQRPATPAQGGASAGVPSGAGTGAAPVIMPPAAPSGAGSAAAPAMVPPIMPPVEAPPPARKK